MEGETRRQDGSLSSRTLRPLWQDSDRSRPGQVWDWGSCPQGASPALHSWASTPAPGLGHGHSALGLACLRLARAFLIPTMGAQSIYSVQLTLNKTLSRDILLSSPLP